MKLGWEINIHGPLHGLYVIYRAFLQPKRSSRRKNSFCRMEIHQIHPPKSSDPGRNEDTAAQLTAPPTTKTSGSSPLFLTLKTWTASFRPDDVFSAYRTVVKRISSPAPRPGRTNFEASELFSAQRSSPRLSQPFRRPVESGAGIRIMCSSDK